MPPRLCPTDGLSSKVASPLTPGAKEMGNRATLLPDAEHGPSVPRQWPCCVHQVAYDHQHLKPSQEEGSEGDILGQVRPSQAPELSLGSEDMVRPVMAT